MKETPASGPIIMVVDDDFHLRYTLRCYLEALGYAVVCAENGERGLTEYQRQFPNISVVLLDMVMPKMNGLDLFYALQRWDPQVKCIMISGNEPSTGVKDALAAGLITFLQKPVSFSVLTGWLEKAIQTGAQSLTQRG